MSEPKPPALPPDRTPPSSTVDNRGASIEQQVIAHTAILESAAIDRLVTTGPYAVEDQPLLRVLKPWEVRRPRTAQPAKLLEAAYEVVPFDARIDVLERLQRFTDEDERDGVQVIVGAGGVGKTRLMLEWCKRLRAREEPWLAGFLQRDLPDDLGRLVQGRAPRLVVLDYAETEPATTARVVRAMVHRGGGPPMRVVLLAREDGSWLRALRKDDLAIEDCVDAHEVIRLGPLYETTEARARGFSRAKARFLDIAGVHAVEPGGDESSGGPALDGALGERVLYMHMQALLEAFGDEDARKGRLSPAQVLERVVDHECGFWKRSFEARGRSVSKRLMQGAEQAAAALVLCGGVSDASAARRLLEAAAPSHAVDDREAVLECFGELYEDGPDGEGIVPIEPDLLGETLVARVLEREERQEGGLERWLALPFGDAAPPLAVGRALTVLTRLASLSVGTRWLQALLRDRGHELVNRAHGSANEGRPEPPGSVLEGAVRWVDDLEVAEAIGTAVPWDTVELREVRATANGLAVRLARGRDDVDDGRLARLLANLGRALNLVGQREEALAATQEAVDIRRGLAREQPDFLPDLACALDNLGTELSSLGRREDALRVTQEAVDVFLGLAQERSDACLPDLALALNNLGIRWSDLGRPEDALWATQEAVKVYRGLAEGKPGVFLPDLAYALNNLGAHLSNLGRREEALQLSQDAVDVFQRLAEKWPDAFLPDLARTLTGLGVHLSKLGRRGEALRVAQEAVDVYRRLAEERPGVFLPDLAIALKNLGSQLNDQGRCEEALRITQEAVDVHRGLAEERPGAFLPDLARALNNLGNRLSDLGKREDALRVTQEAADIGRSLAKERPGVFLPDLASTLYNLGLRLRGVERREEALGVIQEAVEIYRGLAKERPEALLPNLARALTDLGLMLTDVGRQEEALAVTQEAMEVYRGLAKERPDVFLPGLASTLGHLGAHLSKVGRREEALAVAQEGVEVYRGLAEEQPDAFLPNFAGALTNLDHVLIMVGRREEALAVAQEAVEIYRGLAKEHPDAFLPDLARALNNLGTWLCKVGRQEEALAVTQQAVDIRRGLVKEQPDAFLISLANSLGVLGHVHQGANRHGDALDAFAEGLALLRPFFERLPQAFEDLACSIACGALRASQDGGLPLPDTLASTIAQVLDRVTTA